MVKDYKLPTKIDGDDEYQFDYTELSREIDRQWGIWQFKMNMGRLLKRLGVYDD